MTAGRHYDYEASLQDGTSGGWLLRMAGRDQHVLDLGCAAGALDRVLVERGCTVVGVEIDPEAAKLAEPFCQRVIVGDLDSMDLGFELGDEKFDVILAGDVFEHLMTPATVLRGLRSFLKPGGYLALSVPNVAHGSIRLALLHGDFPRDDLGLLDRTHVQFLTQNNLLDLLAESGWTPAFLDGTLKAIEASEVPYPDDELTANVIKTLESDPLAAVYQHLVVAFPVTEDDELAPLPTLLVAARQSVVDQIDRVGQLEAITASLVDQVALWKSAAEGFEAEIAVRQARIDALVATVAELKFTERLIRVDTRLHSDREAERLNGALGYERHLVGVAKAEAVANLEEAAALFDEAQEEIDGLKGTLQDIYRSRLWRIATRYRRMRA